MTAETAQNHIEDSTVGPATLAPEVDLGNGNSIQPAGSILVPVTLLVGVIRESAPRRKCAICKVRRVLYRIGVAAFGGEAATEARCADCWGMRE